MERIRSHPMPQTSSPSDSSAPAAESTTPATLMVPEKLKTDIPTAASTAAPASDTMESTCGFQEEVCVEDAQVTVGGDLDQV